MDSRNWDLIVTLLQRERENLINFEDDQNGQAVNLAIEYQIKLVEEILSDLETVFGIQIGVK